MRKARNATTPNEAAKVEEFWDRQGREPTRWERAALCREAAADTRSPKSGAGVIDLRTRWADEADALGWSPDAVTPLSA